MELSEWLNKNIKYNEYIEFSKSELTQNFEIRLSDYNFEPVRKINISIADKYVSDSFVIKTIEDGKKAIGKHK